jgi:hypothetical protein
VLYSSEVQQPERTTPTLCGCGRAEQPGEAVTVLGCVGSSHREDHRPPSGLASMIMSVDESNNLHPITLVIGYEFVRDAQPSLGGGGRFKRARDAGVIPDGPAHAVESGERRSICGKTMERIIDNPWPPVMGERCRDCQEAPI